jgi:hypothetical protein
MSFKYVNPGYKYLFDSVAEGTTEITNDSKYNPLNKIAFRPAGRGCVKKLPNNCREIWIKFDILIEDIRGDFFYVSTTNGGISFTRPFGSINLNITGTDSHNVTGFLSVGALTSFELHIKSNNNAVEPYDGIVELYINNISVISLKNINALNKEDMLYIGFHSDGYGGNDKVYSNIIITDEGHIGNEKIIELPVLTTLTDWINNNDGTYTTDTIDKNMLTNIDTNKLQAILPELYTINSVSIAGNAFENGTNVNGLSMIIKNNDIIKNVDSQKFNIVDTLKYEAVCKINPFTNIKWTINDLNNTQIGVKSIKIE